MTLSRIVMLMLLGACSTHPPSIRAFGVTQPICIAWCTADMQAMNAENSTQPQQRDDR